MGIEKIPKCIHYCWFGRGEKSEKVKNCISSWQKFLPEYKTIEWNEDNFDINMYPYTKQAYAAKKYAFVSDVARLYVLYHYGGIYMDTDIEVLKPIDEMLQWEGFLVFSKNPKYLRTNFMGAKQGHPWIRKILDLYTDRLFLLEDGSFDMTPNICVGEITQELYHFLPNGKAQILDGSIKIYPSIVSGAYDFETGRVKIKKDSYVIHWNSASFWTKEAREKHARRQKYRRILGIKFGDIFFRIIEIIEKDGFLMLLRKMFRRKKS